MRKSATTCSLVLGALMLSRTHAPRGGSTWGSACRHRLTGTAASLLCSASSSVLRPANAAARISRIVGGADHPASLKRSFGASAPSHRGPYNEVGPRTGGRRGASAISSGRAGRRGGRLYAIIILPACCHSWFRESSSTPHRSEKGSVDRRSVEFLVDLHADRHPAIDAALCCSTARGGRADWGSVKSITKPLHGDDGLRADGRTEEASQPGLGPISVVRVPKVASSVSFGPWWRTWPTASASSVIASPRRSRAALSSGRRSARTCANISSSRRR